MTNLPPPPGQPRETEANTGYSGHPAWDARESPGGRGWGRGPSGRRRGNGPPCPQRVAGLRGRSATLGLRHGPDSYGRQQWGICAMGATLTQRRRVRDEVIRDVNRFQRGRTMTVLAEEAPANYVPAAAVIRRGRALSGIIGRKARVGGPSSGTSNPRAQPPVGFRTGRLEFGRGRWNSRCSGGMRRYREEHRWRRQPAGPPLTLRRESWGSEQD